MNKNEKKNPATPSLQVDLRIIELVENTAYVLSKVHPDMSRENTLILAGNMHIASTISEMVTMMKADRDREIPPPVEVGDDALMEDFKAWYKGSRTSINKNVPFEHYQQRAATYREDFELFAAGWKRMRTRLTGGIGHLV